jgi:uncharacterized membrane protein
MRIHYFLAIIVFSTIALIPSIASAQSDEAVRVFQGIATLRDDRTLTVTENITYDFGKNERHGIFREITTKYERSGGAYKLRLDLKEVTMDGENVPYKIQSRSPTFRIRIGDSDVTITGKHEYSITYETDRAINFFDGEAELYWNVTGDEWEVPILKSSFSIVGPPDFDAHTSETVCYTGAYGTTEQTCQVLTQANTAQFISGRSYAPGEGLTIAIRFPEGMIQKPSLADRLFQIVMDNWILGLPFIVFAFMYYTWRKKGKDPKGKGTVVPQYDPMRGLAPMEMLGLKDQSIGHTAITATMLDLARRGYMKIEFSDKEGFFGKKKQEYAFLRQKEADDKLQSFERTILNGIFDGKDRVDLADLKGTFYKDIAKAKEQAFKSLRTKKLFGKNPNTVRASYMVTGAVLAGMGFWLILLFGFGALGIVSVIASGIIIAVFGWFMPSKTKEGSVALEEVDGFKWFLSVTEKDRMSFHNAPKVRPEKFHEFLPYAIAFGVENAWAKQFEGIDVPPPQYATGIHTWNMLYFANSLHTLDAQAASTAFAAPSSAGSGGSGFSGGGGGGGFGGGGGGSW